MLKIVSMDPGSEVESEEEDGSMKVEEVLEDIISTKAAYF